MLPRSWERDPRSNQTVLYGGAEGKDGIESYMHPPTHCVHLSLQVRGRWQIRGEVGRCMAQ
jgi:hypothetical protein